MKEKENGMLFDNNKFGSFFFLLLFFSTSSSFLLLFVCAIPMQILFEILIHVNACVCVCVLECCVFHLRCLQGYFSLYVCVFGLCLSMHPRNPEWNSDNSKRREKMRQNISIFSNMCNVHSYILFILYLLRLFFSSIQPCKHNDFSDGFWRRHVIALMFVCVSIVLFLSYFLSHLVVFGCFGQFYCVERNMGCYLLFKSSNPSQFLCK